MKFHLHVSFPFNRGTIIKNREDCILGILYIRSTKIKFADICTKFFIVKICIVLIVYYFWWQLPGVNFKFSYAQQVKAPKASLENITILKTIWLIGSNKINVCRLSGFLKDVGFLVITKKSI